MLDFAIIGTPRSATSTAFKALDSHPGIQGSSPKETFFFADPGVLARGVKTVRDIGIDKAGEELFDEPSYGRLRFEGTTHHYYQRTALREYSRMNPPPEVFVLIREPGERIRSSFLAMKYGLGVIASELDFETYVQIILSGESGKLDKFIQKDRGRYISKRALVNSYYSLWLKRWVHSVGADRVSYISFDDFVSRPKLIIGKILEALGLSAGLGEVVIPDDTNATRLYRFPFLQRIARSVGRASEGWPGRETAKRVYNRLFLEDTGTKELQRYESATEKPREHFCKWNRELDSMRGLCLGKTISEVDGNWAGV